MSDDDDGDLYKDLLDTKPAASVKLKTKETVAFHPMSNHPASLVDQLKHVEEKVEALERENLQLKRNMGTLYRTAKREIVRKDEQIAQLMQQLDDAQRRSTA